MSFCDKHGNEIPGAYHAHYWESGAYWREKSRKDHESEERREREAGEAEKKKLQKEKERAEERVRYLERQLKEARDQIPR